MIVAEKAVKKMQRDFGAPRTQKLKACCLSYGDSTALTLAAWINESAD